VLAAVVPDWRPTAVDEAALGARARLWLAAILQLYEPTVLQGLAIMMAMQTLTRIEAQRVRPFSNCCDRRH
jgi:hypothetical protein